MRSVTKVVVGGALAALFSSAYAAEQHAGACKADVEKLCKDVQPGEGRVLECLQTHKADVSPKCTAHLKEVQASVKQLSAACKPDVEKYCLDTPAGKGAIAKCLKAHSDDLSADCKTAVAKMKGAAKARHPMQQPAQQQ
jgi:hypothetical protein